MRSSTAPLYSFRLALSKASSLSLHSSYPYFPKSLSNSAILLSVFSFTSQLSLLIVFILFLFIIVVIICYIYKFLLFFTFINSQHQLGDLSTLLEMTFFCGIVISYKHSAWRNPLMRSSTLSFRGFKKKPEESPGKDTAYTPGRDDIQRHRL